MKKLKIYLDTSIISFFFADDSPTFKDNTIDFFENYSNEYELYISDIVLLEIDKNKDIYLKNKMLEITNKYNIKKLSNFNEMNNIAKQYIENNIVPINKLEDALHISFSTFYQMDILLSWNFKHLANVKKEHKILIENLKLGYNYPLKLLTPLEVLDEQD
jgi:predicted nucleic acid-binding protein